jgi:hypothetical protein
MRTLADQIRGGVMLLSILLLGFTLLLTAGIASARIDSSAEFVMALQQDRFNAIPLAFAVFLLVFTLPRPKVSRRAALAVLVGFVLWLFVWRYLVQCDYGQLRARGVDPTAVLKAAKTE